MIEESLLKSNFTGRDGFIWWIGQVADPKVWRNENSRIDGKKQAAGDPNDTEAWGYRCKVRIIGYHSFDRNELDDNDLPWAHVLSSAAEGSPAQGGFGKLPMLVGGETVLGFFLDGEEAQQPVVMSCFHRTPAVVNVENPNPFDPFPGSQGNLSKGSQATRNKQQKSGTVKEPPTSTPKESNLLFTSNDQILNTVFSTQEDLGVGKIGGVDYSSVFSSSSTLNLAGSFYDKPIIPVDQLYYDETAEKQFLEEFREPVEPSNGCGNNLISQITTQIQNFIRFINGLERTSLGFVDPVKNKIVDIKSEISSVSRIIASIMKLAINGMRDNVFKLIGTLFKELGIVTPPPLQIPVSEAAKNILNIIFCIFEKLFGPLIDFISNLLNGLIGRSTNVPRCASEETIGILISKLASMVDGALSSVLSGLDWLAGGISKIAGTLIGGLNFINQLLSFLDCDGLTCKTGTSWDPFSGITLPPSDNWANVINNIDILGGLGNDVDSAASLLSLFGSGDTPFKDCRKKIIDPQSQSDLMSMPLGTQFYKCLPPEVEIYGDGIGAKAVAIVSSSEGSILTIKVTNPGRGYSYPPEVKIIDKSNYGKGAYAKSTINQNGNINSIYIVDPGKGYCLTNLKEIINTLPQYVGITTLLEPIPETDIRDVGVSTSPVGIVTNIVIERPGLGYTSGDIIQIGDCTYNPVVTPNGSIIDIVSPSSCVNQFKSVPPVTINTRSGEGAVLYPVIDYVPQFVIDNPNLSVGLTTDRIVSVIQCVSTKK